MKKLFLITLILAFIAIPMLEAVTTANPSKITTVPATTIYWGIDHFKYTHTADTLRWTKARGFSVTGESTAIFVSSNDATGVLSTEILNDSTVVFYSTEAADSTAYFWYLIFRK
jgi:hypothetical protein